MKKVLGLCLVLAISNSYALDIARNVKDFEKNGDWNNFTITDHYFGLVLLTRATTTDPNTKITFAINFSASDKCQPFIELIYPLQKINIEDIHNDIYGNIQVDTNPYLRVEAEEVVENGANFAFIGFSGKDITNDLKVGKTVSANFRRYGVAEFSLNGAKVSIDNAIGTCEQFSRSEYRNDV